MFRRILFWSSVIGVFAFLTKFILDLDINKVVYPHSPGSCKHVSGISNGSEDLALLKSGHVFISQGFSFDRSAPKPEGAIFLLDLSAPDPIPSITKMTIIPSSNFDKDEFHPAGISVHEGADGRVILYAASMPTQQIDAFEISLEDKTAKHLHGIKHPLFHAVKDLVLVSPTSFYVTNYSRFSNLLLLEMVFKLPLGTVVYYDGNKAKEVLTGLKGPNGIALSPDGKQLYLALNLAKEFRVYDIQSDHSLKLRETLYLYTGVNNLNVDDKGVVWVGAHPIWHQVLRYLQDPRNFAPSQVLKITFDKKSQNPQIVEVFADPGRMLKASTVAVRYNDRLLIGSLHDKLLLCELKCLD